MTGKYAMFVAISVFCLGSTTSAPAQEVTARQNDPMSVGVGIGYMYGGTGLKGEVRIISDWAVTAGAGTSLYGRHHHSPAAAAANFGLLYYLPFRTAKTMTRLGLSYGENQKTMWSNFEGTHSSAADGFTASGGITAAVSRTVSCEFDLGFAFRSRHTMNAANHSGGLTVAIGFVYAWKTGPRDHAHREVDSHPY